MTLTNPQGAHIVKTVSVDSTNAASISIEDWVRYELFILEDATVVPTGSVTLTVPAIARRPVVIKNSLSFTVTPTITGQSEAADSVLTGNSTIFGCDGNNLRQAGSDTATYAGVKLNKTTGLTGLSHAGGLEILWDTEAWDTDGFHSDSVETGRITIPAAFNGYYAQFSGAITLTGHVGSYDTNLYLRLSGSTGWPGIPVGQMDVSPTTVDLHIPPTTVLLATDDYYDLLTTGSDTSFGLASDRCYFGMDILGPSA